MPTPRAALAAALFLTVAAGRAAEAVPTPPELYQMDKVWTARFTFSAEDWKAMEPERVPVPTTTRTASGRMLLVAGDGRRNGLAAMRGFEFNYVPAKLEFAGATYGKVAVRFKGNGSYVDSQNELKRSMKVDLHEFDSALNLKGLVKLNFHSDYTDQSWMKEVLAYRLYRDAGVPAPRTAYSRVYLTVPGLYDNTFLGLYALVENVDSAFLNDRFGTKKGALFKPVTFELFQDLGDDWSAYTEVYDPKNDPTDAQKKRVIELSKLFSHGTPAEFSAKVGDYVDLDEFARFFAILMYTANSDNLLNFGQNYYLYLDPKTDKFQFLPWDQDRTWGGGGRIAPGRGTPVPAAPAVSVAPIGDGLPVWNVAPSPGRVSAPITAPAAAPIVITIPRGATGGSIWNPPSLASQPFVARVFQNAEFQKLYRAHLEEYSQTIFKPDRFYTQVDEIVAAIRTSIAEEGPAKVAIFNDIVDRALDGTYSPRSIKSFVTQRTPAVISQLASGAPTPTAPVLQPR